MYDETEDAVAKPPKLSSEAMELVLLIRQQATLIRKKLDVVIVDYPTAEGVEKTGTQKSELVRELKATLQYLESISSGINI
jgi:hypothetical protein